MTQWFLALDCSKDGQTRVFLITETGTTVVQEGVRAQEAVAVIDRAITAQSLDTKGIRGTIVGTGAGSFMATRISVTAINGLAAGWQVPAVAVPAESLAETYTWDQAVAVFAGVPATASVTAEYSAEPNIRIPKTSHVV